MRLLLDTHVWFAAVHEPGELGRVCRQALESRDNELWVSPVSSLEFGQLVFSGRIELKGTVEAWVRRSIGELGLQTADLTHAITARAYALPGDLHKDPADRLLIATAIEHGLTLLTADRRILAYRQVMSMNAAK